MGNTKLPHWKNSTTATSLYEPVYNAYFALTLTMPKACFDATSTDPTVILENVTKIDNISTAKAFPQAKDQAFKGAKRGFVGGAVPDQHQEVGLSFEVNLNEAYQMFVFNALRAWCDLVYNPLTGKMGTKRSYATVNGDPNELTKMILTRFDADGNAFYQITLNGVYPISAIEGPKEFDWTNDEIYRIEGWNLRADDYDEVWN